MNDSPKGKIGRLPMAIQEPVNRRWFHRAFLTLPPVAAGILPACLGTGRPAWWSGLDAGRNRKYQATLDHDRAAGGTPAATAHLARLSRAVSGCARFHPGGVKLC